jgi:hypothetical protein
MDLDTHKSERYPNFVTFLRVFTSAFCYTQLNKVMAIDNAAIFTLGQYRFI